MLIEVDTLDRLVRSYPKTKSSILRFKFFISTKQIGLIWKSQTVLWRLRVKNNVVFAYIYVVLKFFFFVKQSKKTLHKHWHNVELASELAYKLPCLFCVNWNHATPPIPNLFFIHLFDGNKNLVHTSSFRWFEMFLCSFFLAFDYESSDSCIFYARCYDMTLTICTASLSQFMHICVVKKFADWRKCIFFTYPNSMQAYHIKTLSTCLILNTVGI